jgi:GNAT superfamily N-acetyltransferase
MKIEIYRSNAELPDHLRGQILSLIRIHWHAIVEDYAGPQALPEEWQPSHVVGTKGDVILSYAGVVRRQIEHRGEILKTYGLSSVYTFPFYRRAGLGSRIVRRATSEIERAGDGDLGLLFTMPALEPFYRRAGWQAMPGMTCLIGDRSKPVTHDAFSMMMFLSPKGRRHRPAFEHGRVYIGEHPW